MQPTERHAGNIYDLGYRRYDGPRLGRAYGIYSLYIHSLRGAFGLGRRASAKILPIGLAIVALIPAAIQLGIAAVASDIIEVFKAEDYYGYVETVLALFCAAVAPELVCRDQASRILSLYFSRSLMRRDYALAKTGALVSALLVLTLGPQMVLFIGNGFAGNDLDGYLRDEADLILPIVVAGLGVSLLLATISLAIASQTSRRSYSAAVIIGVFVVPAPIAGIALDISDSFVARFTVFLSPLHALRGFTDWVFAIGRDGDVATLEWPGWAYAVATAVIIAAASAIIYRRYEGIRA